VRVGAATNEDGSAVDGNWLLDKQVRVFWDNNLRHYVADVEVVFYPTPTQEAVVAPMFVHRLTVLPVCCRPGGGWCQEYRPLRGTHVLRYHDNTVAEESLLPHLLAAAKDAAAARRAAAAAAGGVHPDTDGEGLLYGAEDVDWDGVQVTGNWMWLDETREEVRARVCVCVYVVILSLSLSLSLLLCGVVALFY